MKSKRKVRKTQKRKVRKTQKRKVRKTQKKTRKVRKTQKRKIIKINGGARDSDIPFFHNTINTEDMIHRQLNPDNTQLHLVKHIDNIITGSTLQYVPNINTIDWSLDGKQLVAGSHDFVHIFDTTTWDEVERFNPWTIISIYVPAPHGNILTLKWRPGDGNILAMGGEVNTFKILHRKLRRLRRNKWEYSNTMNTNSYSVDHQDRIWPAPNLGFALAWSPNGAQLVRSEEGSAISIQNVAIYSGKSYLDESKRVHLPLYDLKVSSLEWSPDGKYIAIGTLSGNLYVLNQDTLRHFELGEGLVIDRKIMDEIRSVEWSPDGERLVVGGMNPSLIMLNIIDEKLISESEFDNIGNNISVNSVVWHPTDNTKIATGMDDGSVIVWNADTKDKILEGKHIDDFTISRIGVNGIRTACSSVAWSPDGGQLVSSGDNHLKVWSHPTFNEDWHAYLMKGEKDWWSPPGPGLDKGGIGYRKTAIEWMGREAKLTDTDITLLQDAMTDKGIKVDVVNSMNLDKDLRKELLEL